MDSNEAQNDYKINQDTPPLDEDDSLISRNLTSFIIGAIFVIILPVLGLFIFLHTRSSSSNTKTAVATQAQVPNTPTTAPQTQPQVPIQTHGTTQPTTATQTYTNNQFNYTVKIPSNWVAFLRISMSNGFQIGFHQNGMTDTPIVINSQTNAANAPIQNLVNAEFPGVTTQTTTIAGAQAIVATDANRGVTSYFFTHNGNIFEISATTNSTYSQVLNQMISSFTFTK